MNRADFMLRETRQTQKDKSHFYEGPRMVKFIETEVEWWVPGAGGEGGWELGFNEDRVAVLQDEKSYGDRWW